MCIENRIRFGRTGIKKEKSAWSKKSGKHLEKSM